MSTASAAPSDAEKETARSLMDDGDRLRAAQDLASALQRYQAAHEIMNVPTTGIEVAKTHAALGQLVEARRIAIEVANLPVIDGEAQVMAQARKEATSLSQSLAARIPSVLIQVWPKEVQASIVVDGVQLPAAARGLPYKTNPGEHSVQVSAPGYQTAEQRFTLLEGAETSVTVNLVADPQAQPAGLQPAPTPATQAPPMTPAASPAATPAETPASYGQEPETASGSNALIAFGIAGAGAVVGTVTGLMSLNKKSSAEKFCDGNTCTAEAQDDIDSSKSLATFSNIGFGVALVASAWGVYEVLATPATAASPAPAEPSDAPQTSVSLHLAPGEASAVIWGAF